MTTDTSSSGPSRSGIALRACGAGACAAAVGVGMLLALTAVLDLLPEGTAGWAVWGTGVGLVTGVVGMAIQARLSTVAAGPTAGSAFVLGIAAQFFLQLITVTVAAVALDASGLKFEATAAFCTAFALTVTLIHGVGVAVLSRALLASPSQPLVEAGTR